MTTDDEIFAAALDCPADERVAFLENACANGRAQLERLRELLASHGDATGFLRGPAVTREAPPPVEQPGDKLNHYKLVQRIGEGGVGVVWMAQQEQPLRRMVALKVIKLGMDTQAVVARFEAERQALALMDHPSIAKVFDAGVTNTGRPYFVMELVRGVPITKYCDESQLTTPQRLGLFIAVCDAVHHAHQKGVIHRDLKPSNILVTENGGTAVPKVIDFGIAKATQGRLGEATVITAFEQFIGTPVYMSPEQADMTSLDVDTRSDIYSLGVLLFELLTGRTPFDAKTILEGGYREVGRRIREVEPARPSERLATLNEEARATVARSRRTAPAQLRLDLRGDLDWIVMRCLEKDRARRYESASALALDLQRHLRDEPVVARPPSTLYLAQKLFRRHRAAMTAALVAATVLVVGGGFSVWQAVRATRAEREQARLRGTETELLRRAEEKEHLARRRAYSADMNLAQQALANDNLGLAKSLLERHRPAAGETDLRGWEWRYLWQLTQNEAAAVLARKTHSITSLSVSGDQNWLALAAADGGEVTVINMRTRQEFALQITGGAVRVMFSPVEPVLAISSMGGRESNGQLKVRLWSAVTRQFLTEWTAGGVLGFSGDGQTLVTGSGRRGGPLAHWKIPSGELAREVSIPGGEPGAMSEDLGLLARADMRSGRGNVQVLDARDGTERWSFDLSDENVTALAFSRDGRFLAAAAGNTVPTIQVWNTATGKSAAVLKGHRTYITALRFWPDGKTLASAGTDQTVRLWDVTRGEMRRVLRGHELEVRSLALAGDTTLISGAKDGAVFLWDIAAPETQRRYRIDGVSNWAFAPDGDGVVILDAEGIVSVHGGAEFNRTEEKLRLTRMATGPAGRSGQPQGGSPPFPGGGRGGGRGSARTSFAHDAPLLASAGADGVVQIFDWRAGRLLRELATGPAQWSLVGFTRGGAQLLVAQEDGDPARQRLHAWDVTTGKETRSWPVALARPARYMLAPDARHVVMRAAEGEMAILEFSSGTERSLPVVTSMTGGVAFSPDGRWLALPSTVGWVKIWSVKGNEGIAELTGFVLGVHSAGFSPDSHRLIAGSSGTEAVRLWETDGFEPLMNLTAEGSLFGTAAFSPGGDVIGARNGAAQLYLWRAPSLTEITAAESRSSRPRK